MLYVPRARLSSLKLPSMSLVARAPRPGVETKTCALAMGCPDSSMTCPLIDPCAAPSICACARVAAHRAQSTSAQMTSARPGRLAKRGRGRGMIAVQRRLKLRRRILSVVERDLYLAAVGYVDERALSGLASLRGQADERQF